MTKTLSEQLCEIVGLSYSKTVGEICEILPNKSRRIFLDFEQPENFVNLLKIANDTLGKVEFATAYTQNKKGIFEEQALKHYLLQTTLNEAFKQSIRDYDGWVWG